MANDVLRRYARATDSVLVPPLRAADILDNVFGDELNSLLWEEIPEHHDRTILAGLAPAARVIVLNERRRKLLTDTPGLINDTVGHELGHGLLHVDRDLLEHPLLPGIPDKLDFRCGPADEASQAGYDSWDERNAHMFMAHLLMPADLLVPRARAADLGSWPGLYRLRDDFQVSITAMRIRLRELRFTYVDRAGTFHRSRDEAAGQQLLFDV